MEPRCWAFNTAKWSPTLEEWESLLESVESSERERVKRFRFEKDRKRALAGRVMLRTLVAESLGVAASSLKFDRTAAGKPFLVDTARISFNLSHHGDYVVLVVHPERIVGVDVMDYEPPRSEASLEEYFELMQSSFTQEEWDFIKCRESDSALDTSNLRRFVWMWSLKEAYLKALGVGIGFGLQRASFRVTEQATGHSTPRHVGTGELVLDGTLNRDYSFTLEELDERHCVAVALQRFQGDDDSTVIWPQWTLLEHLL